MNTPPRKMAEHGLYKPVWREFNRMIDYIREISPVAGRNIKISRTSNGTLFVGESVVKADPGTPGVVKQFRIKTISTDTLICDEIQGVGSVIEIGDQKTIAKPWRLRKTPFHNQPFSIIPPGAITALNGTYSYNASNSQFRSAIVNSGYVESQYVTRAYAVDDVIYASISENGTLIQDVDWIDLNVDGRAWAASG